LIDALLGGTLSFSATEFEFKHRFWIFLVLFWGSFALFRTDHTYFSLALAQWMADHRLIVSPDHVARDAWIIIALGSIITGFASLIRSWATAYLNSAVVQDTELHSDQIVADGPYRHLRNPLYLGTFTCAVGLGTMASRAGLCTMVVGVGLFCLRLILREEAKLLQSQGDSYRKFLEAVPRVIPSLWPRLPASGRRPNWADGFFGETFMWGLALAMAVFALTKNVLHLYIIMGAGFVVYFLQDIMRRRAKKAKIAGNRTNG
jgi:protein-S-isoprenylcysteine O-methyltransferase Ste14